MAEEQEPLQIVLTPEQRQAIHRMSGQHVEMIEITPEEAREGGGPLHVKWRLSAASGIPRLNWEKDGDV